MMNLFKDKKKIQAIIKLGRYKNQIGTFYFLIPSCWGICLASPELFSYYTIKQVAIFSLGSFNIRSAGCIINDYYDQEFDKKVERTKIRPLASKELSNKEALTIFSFHTIFAFWSLFNLSYNAQLLSLSYIPFLSIYPLAKRYTYYPQLVLGLVINAGVMIAGINNYNLNYENIIPFYISGILWTLIYDTFYGHQDIQDDLKVGVKSLAIRWGENTIRNSKILNLAIFSLLNYGGYLNSFHYAYNLCIFSSFIFMNYQINNTNINDPKSTGKFFRNNKYFGINILIAIIIGNMWK